MYEDTKLVRLLKVLGFILLLFGATLFLKKTIEDYNSKATSITHSTEHVESFESPIIVICFNPFAKPSKLTEFNITETFMILSSDIQKHNSNIYLSKPWNEMYGNASYRVKRDFGLEIFAKDGSQKLSIENNEEVVIEEIYTFWSGLCTKLKIP